MKRAGPRRGTGRTFLAALAVVGTALGTGGHRARAQEQAPSPTPTASTAAAETAGLSLDGRPLPITLPTAFQLADARAIDVAAAAQRVRVAEAVLEQARVLWLPSVSLGADYFRHDGPVQDVSNAVFNDSHSGTMVGVGSGIGPAAVLDVGNAVFAPLVARQQLRAREADRRTASNDTLLAVAEAYFNVQQARGELGGAREATRRTEDLVQRTRKLAPDVVPELETDRAEAELARRQQTEFFALERWKVASAELLRVLRLDPGAQVEPAEPPHLRIELIDLKLPLDQLIPVGLTSRPELASQQAQVQATLALLRQERLRPLIPSILLRGASTSPSATLGAGVYFPTPNGSQAGMREDVDVQVLWQLNNLGFGNRAAVHQRQAENQLAVVELFRLQDRVAAEVARAYAEAQMASQRLNFAGREVRSARASADKNLFALGQTRGAGGQVQLLVRPQEAVASVQALAQAYADYYGAVADSNRAQFRLYRALGHPAGAVLADGAGCLAPPATAVVPPAPAVAAPAPAVQGR
jgi:outer membrane protein TolC